jgi:hypothetical protein
VEHEGAELEDAEGQGVADELGLEEPGEDGDEQQARGDGGSLEIADLAGAVCELGGSCVVAGEAAEAAEDEVQEPRGVPAAAEADGEAEHGRGDAERDEVCERVELLAEQG